MTKLLLTFASTLLLAAGAVFGDSESRTVDYYHDILLYGENPTDLPDWILSVEQEDGAWLEQPSRWVVDGNLEDGRGRMAITIDREKFTGDLGISLISEDDPDADIAVQLLDEEGRVIAVDLVGNAITAGREAQTDIFAIPLRKYPAAASIAIQRITGPITIYGVVLFPLVIGAEEETGLMTQLELLKLSKQQLSPDSLTFRTIVQIMREKDASDAGIDNLSADDTAFPLTPSPSADALEAGRDGKTDTSQLVGIDLYHGIMWESGVELLKTNSYQPMLIESPITDDALRDLGVLIIAPDGLHVRAFEDSEVKAIAEFVRNGGGLLCAAQAWSWNYKAYGNKPVEDYPLNALGREFGFTITGQNIGAPKYVDPHFPSDVKEVVRNEWWPSAILFSTKTAHPFIRDGKLRVMAGSLDYGRGRVVVLGHGSMAAENPKLVSDILRYLSGPE